MGKREAVFMRFTHLAGQEYDYFVGASEAAILGDTNGGTSFGGRTYKPGDHQVVPREEVEKLGLQFFVEGVVWVEERGIDSFLLG